MLCVTVPKGERVTVSVPPSPFNHTIEIHVRGTKGDRVKLAFDAPPEVIVTRPFATPLSPAPPDSSPL